MSPDPVVPQRERSFSSPQNNGKKATSKLKRSSSIISNGRVITEQSGTTANLARSSSGIHPSPSSRSHISAGQSMQSCPTLNTSDHNSPSTLSGLFATLRVSKKTTTPLPEKPLFVRIDEPLLDALTQTILIKMDRSELQTHLRSINSVLSDFSSSVTLIEKSKQTQHLINTILCDLELIERISRKEHPLWEALSLGCALIIQPVKLLQTLLDFRNDENSETLAEFTAFWITNNMGNKWHEETSSLFAKLFECHPNKLPQTQWPKPQTEKFKELRESKKRDLFSLFTQIKSGTLSGTLSASATTTLAKNIASDLTKYELIIYKNTTPHDLIPEKHNSTPSIIQEQIHTFNSLSNFIIDTILFDLKNKETPVTKEQVNRMASFYLEVATQCIKKNNFATAGCIHAALDNSEVSRLFEEPIKQNNSFTALNDLFDPKNHFLALRNKTAQHTRCIPYFPHLKGDITRFSELSQPYFGSDQLLHYNYDVLFKLHEVVNKHLAPQLQWPTQKTRLHTTIISSFQSYLPETEENRRLRSEELKSRSLPSLCSETLDE